MSTGAVCLRRLPVLFISHGGGPGFLMNDEHGSMFNAVNKNSPAADFMRSLSTLIPSFSTSVKNILVISAHWEEENFTVSYQDKGTSLIYDYYGFPAETYAPYVTYPAPTDLNLANRVADLMINAGLKCSKANRGFDHGVFIPLMLAVPTANIPIVQLSLKSNLNFEQHIHLGEIIAPLREEGTLIICSGQTTHNLRNIGTSSPHAVESTLKFTEWIRATLEGINSKDDIARAKVQLTDIMTKAPYAKEHHPRVEHLVPLHVAYGAGLRSDLSGDQGDPPSAKRVFTGVALGTMSLDSYVFSS